MSTQKATQKKSTETKPGRPTGAKTKERDVITATIDREPCRKCGDTGPVKNKRFRRRANATNIYDADCGNCGQAFVYREVTK